jgi:hypothetical protein
VGPARGQCVESRRFGKNSHVACNIAVVAATDPKESKASLPIK